MEKAFLAKIDEEVLKNTRAKCKIQGYPIGDCVEALMKEFAARDFDTAEFVLAVQSAKKPIKKKVKENAAENASVSSTGNETEGRTTGVQE